MKNNQYRLALDLGSTSIGWAMLNLEKKEEKMFVSSIIKTGCRLFDNGLDRKDETSKAAERRKHRSMRRNRDRFLRRQTKLRNALLQLSLLPQDQQEYKKTIQQNPIYLRYKALNESITLFELGRALLHLNLRRGFQSNRKDKKSTSSKKDDTKKIQRAIKKTKEKMQTMQYRTIGEFMFYQLQNFKPELDEKHPTKCNENVKIIKIDKNGKEKETKEYNFYRDRKMMKEEFELIWETQKKFHFECPQVFSNENKQHLYDIIFFQRPLKPVKPGYCTFEEYEFRAPKALPSFQEFRILQDLNHLKIEEGILSLEERAQLFNKLNKQKSYSFNQIKKDIQKENVQIKSAHKDALKGNITNCLMVSVLKNKWFEFELKKQDEIVLKILEEENEENLISYLKNECKIDDEMAQQLLELDLPEGYSHLSYKAIQNILPHLKKEVITYDKACNKAGYENKKPDFTKKNALTVENPQIRTKIKTNDETGEREIQTKEFYPYKKLPYYGEILPNCVGFASRNPQDSIEKRFGKINNPTVHIALNQVQKLVNALIEKYGHPHEIVIELARDLKNSKKQRKKIEKENEKNKEKNKEYAKKIEELNEKPNAYNLLRFKLWEEQNKSCVYSGQEISAEMALSAQTEIDHIVPFSISLDDSNHNKVLVIKKANQIKGAKTPFQAKEIFEKEGENWSWKAMTERIKTLPQPKQERFSEHAHETFHKNNFFLPRALNDTRYISRVAKDYLECICPEHVLVSSGKITAIVRHLLGLNTILNTEENKKNRNDHRHHAVDACVIGIITPGLINQINKLSAQGEIEEFNSFEKILKKTNIAHPNFREQVKKAIEHIRVSYKPNHHYQGEMMKETAYSLQGETNKRDKKNKKTKKLSQNAIVICDKNNQPYKAYESENNYCMEFFENEQGKWQGKLIRRFDAYQIIRKFGEKEGMKRLRNPYQTQDGKKLLMRLMINDCVQMLDKNDGIHKKIYRVVKLTEGRITFAEIHEANVDKRNRAILKKNGENQALTVEKSNSCPQKEATISFTKTPDQMRQLCARPLSISILGKVHYLPFKFKHRFTPSLF